MKNFLTLAFAFFLLTFMSCSKEGMDPYEVDGGAFIIDENPEMVEGNINIATIDEANGEGLTNNAPTTVALKTTMEYLATEDDLSMFHEAVIKTGISSQIDGDGPYTIFAPTNDAFEAFLAQNNWTKIDDISVSVLNTVVSFHISQSEVIVNDLTLNTSVNIMFNNFDLMIHAVSSPAYLTLGLTKASFVEIDAEQTNGMVNKIDSVLSL